LNAELIDFFNFKAVPEPKVEEPVAAPEPVVEEVKAEEEEAAAPAEEESATEKSEEAPEAEAKAAESEQVRRSDSGTAVGSDAFSCACILCNHSQNCT